MKRNTKYTQEMKEVKKIKAKLQTTSLIAIAALLVVIPLVSSVDAAEPYTIQGGFDGNSIVILIDGIDNAITLNYEGVTSYHYDGKLKTYNSGGFIIKNLDSGIVVFGHPIGNEQYRLVLLTDGNIHRLIGVSSEFTQIDTNPSYEEPVSSVGSDITKYDIPTETGRAADLVDPMILTITGQVIPEMFRLGDDFEWTGKVYNAREGTSAVMTDIPVTLEMSRDNFVIRSYTQDTSSGGQVRFLIDEIDYPEFYPEFCYEMKIITTYNGTETVVKDDFVMQYTFGTKIWEPNTSWMGLNEWNHLPTDYKKEPRPRVSADEKCNQ